MSIEIKDSKATKETVSAEPVVCTQSDKEMELLERLGLKEQIRLRQEETAAKKAEQYGCVEIGVGQDNLGKIRFAASYVQPKKYRRRRAWVRGDEKTIKGRYTVDIRPRIQNLASYDAHTLNRTIIDDPKELCSVIPYPILLELSELKAERIFDRFLVAAPRRAWKEDIRKDPALFGVIGRRLFWVATWNKPKGA